MLTGQPGEDGEGKAAELDQDAQKGMRAPAAAMMWVGLPPSSRGFAFPG